MCQESTYPSCTWQADARAARAGKSSMLCSTAMHTRAPSDLVCMAVAKLNEFWISIWFWPWPVAVVPWTCGHTSRRAACTLTRNQIINQTGFKLTCLCWIRDVFWMGPPAPKVLGPRHQRCWDPRHQRCCDPIASLMYVLCLQYQRCVCGGAKLCLREALGCCTHYHAGSPHALGWCATRSCLGGAMPSARASARAGASAKASASTNALARCGLAGSVGAPARVCIFACNAQRVVLLRLRPRPRLQLWR